MAKFVIENMQLIICQLPLFVLIHKDSKIKQVTDEQLGIREAICAIPDLLYLSQPFRIADEFGYHKFWFRALLGYYNKSATMKKRNPIPDHQTLLSGELYLFHPADHAYPAISSLFGIFDKSDSSILYLESSSSDFIHFRLWHRLPDDYCCCRRASRSELRDYIFNLASYEHLEMQHVGVSVVATRCGGFDMKSCTHL